MKYKYKFMIAEGLMIFAFAYAAKGYHAAAVFTAVCTVLFAYDAAAGSLRQGQLLKLVLAGGLEALAIRGTCMMAVMPSLPAVSFCALAAAVLLITGNWRKLHHSIRTTVMIYGGFILITLLVPSAVYGTSGTILILSLLFVPWLAVYSFCRLSALLRMSSSSGLKEEVHVR